jgi:hypothetical protein
VQLTLNAVFQLEQHVNVRFFYRLEKSAVETPLKLMVVGNVQLLRNLLFTTGSGDLKTAVQWHNSNINHDNR